MVRLLFSSSAMGFESPRAHLGQNGQAALQQSRDDEGSNPSALSSCSSAAVVSISVCCSVAVLGVMGVRIPPLAWTKMVNRIHFGLSEIILVIMSMATAFSAQGVTAPSVGVDLVQQRRSDDEYRQPTRFSYASIPRLLIFNLPLGALFQSHVAF